VTPTHSQAAIKVSDEWEAGFRPHLLRGVSLRCNVLRWAILDGDACCASPVMQLVPVILLIRVIGVPSTLEPLMPNPLAVSRSLAFSRQSGRCFYCDFPMWTDDPESFASEFNISLRQAKRLKCTAEHLIPRQDGGTSASANIAAACLSCNQQRHRRPVAPPPDVYREHVKRRVRKRKWHAAWASRALIASTPG
jgi:HNH endonuclease